MIWSQESLQALPEIELCQKVLVPLFEAMDYKDIDFYHGGSLEQGKDFVMWREEPPKGRVNYAVIVKAKKITGAASGGMHEVLMQIKQSLGSHYIDKKTSEEQIARECYLVSSHEIKKEGSNSFHSLLVQENLLGRISIIDGNDLWKLVQKHLPQYTVHSQLSRAYDALGSPHPDYEFAVSMKGKERYFELAPKHSGAAPIEVSPPTFPETSEGQRKKEEFQAHLKTGTKIELTNEHIPFENLPTPLRLLLPFAEGQPYTITMGSSQLKQPIPLSLTVEGDGGSSFTLPTINLTEACGGSESTTLSNEGQPIPLKIVLKVSDKGHISFNYKFNFPNQSIYWLVQATKLQELLAGGARLIVRDLDTGIAISSFSVPPGRTKSWGDQFSTIARGVLEIQDLTQTSISLPDREYFLDRDVKQFFLIRRIIDTGKLLDGVEDLRFILVNKPGVAKALLEVLEKRQSFRVDLDDHIENLLDQAISLGPYQVYIPSARLSPKDLKQLNLCACGKSKRKELPLKLMPGEGSSIVVTFSKWSTQQHAGPTVGVKDDAEVLGETSAEALRKT